MDNLETPTPTPEQPAGNRLEEQYRSLHGLVVSVLILLLVLAGTFDLFLLRQYRTLTGEIAGARQMLRVNAEIGLFVSKLQEYGRTHPDFVPVLTKYGLPTAAAPGAAPVTASPPAAARPAKK